MALMRKKKAQHVNVALDEDKKEKPVEKKSSFNRKAMVSEHIEKNPFESSVDLAIPEENLRIQKIALGQIRLDPNNSRTRDINLAKPTVNPFEEGHPRYKETQSEIDEIITMAEHLKEQPLRQMISLYQENGKYYVAIGNRRFLSLLVAFGPDHATNFRMYPRKPVDLALARFQENSQRKDLAVYPHLLEFKGAYECFKSMHKDEVISDAKTAEALGAVKSQFSILKRAVENEDIMRLADQGIIQSKESLKQLVKMKSFDEMMAFLMKGEVVPAEVKEKTKEEKKGSVGRRKISVSIPPKITKDLSMMEKLVRGELNSFFSAEDFVDFNSLQERFKRLADELTDKK